MSDLEPLLDCPFCGKPGKVITHPNTDPRKTFAVSCNQGHRTKWYARRDRATETWNQRAGSTDE